MNHLESQLYAVAPFPIGSATNGQFRVKFPSGATGGRQSAWVNLTPEQFRLIEQLVINNPEFK